MMTVIIISQILISLLIILVICITVYKYKKNEQLKIQENTFLDKLFELHDFNQNEVLKANKHLFLALNKSSSRVAIIKNFNLKNISKAEFIALPLSCIIKIEQFKTHLKLSYLNNFQEEAVEINSTKKEVKDFLHNVYKKAILSLMEKKYKLLKFDLVSSSDWSCEYVWAYCSYMGVFIYYDTKKQLISDKIYILKDNLTLNTKYSYLEMPIYNIAQQLPVYDCDFYDELFNKLLKKIDEKYASIIKNILYYDDNNSIVFLTNGINSLQIINLKTIEEVEYFDNKLSFKMLKSDKVINFIAPEKLIEGFKDFVINYNLKKISQGFNYETDRLINTSPCTKLIIDNTKKRVIYCANLNTFSKFNYFVFPFYSICDVEYFKTDSNIFVRFYTNENEKFDVSCTKTEVAQYILAQARIIIGEQNANQ